MIAFFPELYPDELLYSAFARYYDLSGYGIYRAAAEDLYQNRLANPDILFVNPITADLKKISMKVLKGEYSDTSLKLLDTVGGGIASGADGIGDSIGETIGNLFGNLLGGK